MRTDQERRRKRGRMRRGKTRTVNGVIGKEGKERKRRLGK